MYSIKMQGGSKVLQISIRACALIPSLCCLQYNFFPLIAFDILYKQGSLIFVICKINDLLPISQFD